MVLHSWPDRRLGVRAARGIRTRPRTSDPAHGGRHGNGKARARRSERPDGSRQPLWVPLESLSPEQLKTVRPGCCGAYIEPSNSSPDAALSPADAPLRATADTTDAQGETAILNGNVQITQGSRRVRS